MFIVKYASENKIQFLFLYIYLLKLKYEISFILIITNEVVI